jgi:4-carboxymuconolactone decarboxylase
MLGMTVQPADDRLPPLPPEQWTPEQRAAAAALIATPRGALRGPFVPLLRSPELLDRAQQLGAYLRYRCSLPEPLREFAILVIARYWRQRYEWHTHAPLAQRTGTPDAVIAALARGERPAAMSSDHAVVYDFCQQLQARHSVDDATYGRALALWGEAGVVDLSGLCGYYTLLAMVMNAARTPVPGNPSDPFSGAD